MLKFLQENPSLQLVVIDEVRLLVVFSFFLFTLDSAASQWTLKTNPLPPTPEKVKKVNEKLLPLLSALMGELSIQSELSDQPQANAAQDEPKGKLAKVVQCCKIACIATLCENDPHFFHAGEATRRSYGG